MKRAAALGALLLTLGGAGTAAAQHGGNADLFPPMLGFSCHEGPLPQARPGAPPVPLQQKARPPTLAIAPFLMIDVAVVEALPAANALAAPLPPNGDQDFLCIGMTRGRAAIERVLEAPPGTRLGAALATPLVHRWADWHGQNARAAGVFAFTETIPSLRRALERPIPASLREWAWEEGSRRSARAQDMFALADLRDTASAATIATMLHDGSLQGIEDEALAALARLDAPMAQRAAIDIIRRWLALPPQPPSETTPAWVPVLPYLTKASAEDLALVRQLPEDTEARDLAGTAACRVLAARLRLGDAPLRKKLRAEFMFQGYNSRVRCDREVWPLAFPGDDPEDIDGLLLRSRYAEIAHFIERANVLAVAGQLPPAWRTGEARLLEWLRARSHQPVVADRGLWAYDPYARAYVLAEMAALGDAGSRTELYLFVDTPESDGSATAAPWVAARLALRLGIPGAADHAVVRLKVGMTPLSGGESGRSGGHRQGLPFLSEDGLLVDELVRVGDPRFALGLLSVLGREAALWQLARAPNANACEVVGLAARQAQYPDVWQAFWALSLLGDACRPTMWRLLNDEAQPATVRGPALEALARMRDPRIEHLLTDGPPSRRGTERFFADIIFHATE